MSAATCLTSRCTLTTRRLPKGAHLCARNISVRRRGASTKAAPLKSYASTLLLPKTKFKLWPDYTARDNALGKRTNQSLYAWQWANNKGPIFIFHDGPPYANGALHMGHGMNKILKDIINRYHVLLGRRVNYVPGWDCHGLPIEIKTLEQLKAPPNTLPAAEVRKHAERFARKQIKSQMAEFQKLSIMANWTESETYKTIDRDYEIRQLRLLQELVRKNLIYRRHRPVFWSPSSQSALAEAEVGYVDDHTSRSAYVTFRITEPSPRSLRLQGILDQAGVSDAHFLVWTTTPWTIPANMGIAVNTEMEYTVARLNGHDGSRVVILGTDLVESVRAQVGELESLGTLSGEDLVGTTYTNVFKSPSPLRVLPSRHVTATSGTGVVHMAPAHGAEDYAVFLAEGLLDDPSKSVVCPVNDAGQYSTEILQLARSDEHGERLLGKSVLTDGALEALAILRETGVLVTDHAYKHRYPYDSRTNHPMIIRATSQWFANVGEIKDKAFAALEHVKFYPESARVRLESFIRDRTEWCISRQRVWGSPIPSLHDSETGEAILTAESLEHIIAILEQKGVSYWWTGDVEEFIPPSLRDSGRRLTKGTDTIDVWFDSGSSWTMLDAVERDQKPDSHRVRPADVVLEGSDQHRGWFQSLLLTAVGSARAGEESRAPYRSVITHGFVLDEDGRKMSKSLGNIITPTTIISGGEDLKKQPAYGVDVLRLWAAGVDYTKDVSVGPSALAQVAESVRKLRNTARFMLSNVSEGQRPESASGASKAQMSLLDRYVMHELFMLESRTKEAYSCFNIHTVTQLLTTFSNSILSSLYFDVTKDVLYAENLNSVTRRSVVTVIEKTLDVYTSILAPILPQLAEEIHERRRSPTDPESSVFELGWQSVDESWRDPLLAEDMGVLLQLRDRTLQLLEKARREGRIRSALEASVDIRLIHGSADSGDAQHAILQRLVEPHVEDLKSLFIVSYVTVDTDGNSPDPRDTAEWQYSCDHHGFRVTITPSPHHKCPRCWQWTAPVEDELCVRCHGVLEASNHA